MTLSQNSNNPTGVDDTSPEGSSGATRARLRKAHAALQMRKEFRTWDDIAAALGYPTPRAAIVATELALERELYTVESAEFMRKMAGERYDALLATVWPAATNPNDPNHLAYIDRARQLMAAHAENHGYTAPKRSPVASPVTAQIESWVSQVLQLQTPEVAEADILDAEVISDTDDPPVP